MARPVGFEGANNIFRAPAGLDGCGDLQVFQTPNQIISCWRMTEADLAEINRTGVVWLSVTGQATPPVCVSGEALVQIDGKPVKAEPFIEPAVLGGEIDKPSA